MGHFLINSTACLFALWMFYKLALENTSWHFFKRYYLIGAVLVSIVIPFVVVETIVIPVEPPAAPSFNFAVVHMTTAVETQPEFEMDWSVVILGIYLLGIFIMLWRFIKNILSFKIQVEDELSNYGSYQLVLRNFMTAPHSFLKRIFVSKQEYLDDKIPNAVLEHEKAHLDQKHSLDILFIEILLILFWFHPLLYIIRYSIKLNHEFLADHAVIKQGTSTTVYQETLLRYTQESHSAALANTFNFPIIKKRFTIMKTQTSSTSLLLRSLALIPVLALLVMSCGKKVTEFKEKKEIREVEGSFNTNSDSENKNSSNDKLLVLNGNISKGTLEIENKTYTYRIEDKEIVLTDKDGNKYDYINDGYEIVTILAVVDDLTPEIIEEYNTLAIKHKEYMDENDLIVFKDDTDRMQIIFNSMSPEQREQNEPWSYLDRGYSLKAGEIPPPPPPVSNPLNFERIIQEVKGKKSKVFIGNEKQNLNQLQQIADHLESKKNINVSFSSFSEQVKNNIKHYYFGNMVFSDLEQNTDFENWRVKNNRTTSFPTPLDHIDFYGDKMNYYIDGKKVNAVKAKAFIEKQGDKGVQIMPINGVNSSKMSWASSKWTEGFQEGFDNPKAESAKEKKSSTKKNEKNVILNSPKITTDDLNKSKDSNSTASFYVEVANEPDSKDFKLRKAMIMASLNQNKPLKYELNGKASTIDNIQEYLVGNENADVAFIEGDTNTLSFSKSNSKGMSLTELQEVYTQIFKYRPKENPVTFMSINETKWKVVTINAQKAEGSFTRKENNYTYNAADLNNIKVYDKDNRLLSNEEFKELQMGFSPVWINGEQKYKELIKTPEVKEAMKNGTFAVFYDGGYTTDYDEALKVNASNSFLRMGSTLEGKTINLHPHSYADTNPSLRQFQKYLKE